MVSQRAAVYRHIQPLHFGPPNSVVRRDGKEHVAEDSTVR